MLRRARRECLVWLDLVHPHVDVRKLATMLEKPGCPGVARTRRFCKKTNVADAAVRKPEGLGVNFDTCESKEVKGG